MPKVDPGLLDGLHGRVDKNFYFRVVNGKTYMSAMPKKRTTKKGVIQKECSKFRLAVVYALLARNNAALVKLYKPKARGFNSVYTMAIADFMKAPEIVTVFHNDYTGQPGSEIRITVKNIIRVRSVTVTITGADGKQIEEGEAILLKNGSSWNYQAVSENSTTFRTTILVTAIDYPGNKVFREILL
jgi:hypothetical protein